MRLWEFNRLTRGLDPDTELLIGEFSHAHNRDAMHATTAQQQSVHRDTTGHFYPLNGTLQPNSMVVVIRKELK